jgi:uncharacterized membrane protein YcjF (UPF0283 family)
MKLEIREVIGLTLVISGLLFLTGLSVVPFVNKLTTDAWTQNTMYAIGRVPVVFAAIFIYLNSGKS